MTLHVNGIDLHWTEDGEGEALLWLHGALGTGEDWRHVFGQPPRGFRIIAPDLRGHGRSTDPFGQFSFRQCAADVLALLQYRGLSRVRAIGISGGGIVLLHLASMAPTLVTHLVLVSVPPRFPEQARRLQRQFGETLLGEEEVSRLRALHAGGEAQVRALFDVVRRMADQEDDVAFTPQSMAAVRTPALIVFGDRDPLYPVETAFDLHRCLPHAHLWMIPNAGHVPVFGTAASAFSDVALPFLRGAWATDH